MLIFTYVPSGSHTSPHRSLRTVPARPSMSFPPACVVWPSSTCPPSLPALEPALFVCRHTLAFPPLAYPQYIHHESTLPCAYLNVVCSRKDPDLDWVWFALETSLEDRNGKVLCLLESFRPGGPGRGFSTSVKWTR